MVDRSPALSGKHLQPNLDRGRLGLLAAGGLAGAIAASSCCILPLALFGLGISGSWIGNLTALEPYQPVLLALSAGFVGTGYYMAYRSRKRACAEGSTCGRPLSNRLIKWALWIATVLTAAAAAFPYVAPTLLGV